MLTDLKEDRTVSVFTLARLCITVCHTWTYFLVKVHVSFWHWKLTIIFACMAAVFFSLYIFYRPFFFLISCSALPKSTVFLAFPRLSACVFFPLLLKCQWKHRKSKPVSLIGITDDLVYQIGDQCCCLPKLRWTVHFMCKETYLIVELYC